MWSWTPAFAAKETKVCRSEWNVASGVRTRRPSNFTDYVVLVSRGRDVLVASEKG